MTAADLDRYDRVRALRWLGDRLDLLDQRILPRQVAWLSYTDAAGVAQAIHDLVVRGAPAIGVTAAYAVVLAARARGGAPSRAALSAELALLRASRPTAVNLFWALDRMGRALDAGASLAALDAEARAIEAEDLAANRRMGELGAALIAPGSGVLTHCTPGSLATAGFGTALGVIRTGVAQGRITRVFNTETRPWLQGARLTSWELLTDGIPAKLIADGAGAHLFATGQVQWLVVGADRICANGDTANKIGTCELAIAARHYGVRVMVVAPASTVDLATARGADIEIELRAPDELLGIAGVRTTADGVQAWNPVFDVTPAALVDALVTERGVLERPEAVRMAAAFATA
ncbi:MAG: S-methyl-5-thioribose-1-phosphate isomerase [Pseudomonadota bacterium]